MRALILIDIQNGLTKKKTLYNESVFFDTINSVIKLYRDSDFKIIFVQHNNNQLKNGTSDWEIDNRIDKQENDCVIQKKHGNAFQNTDLKTTLMNLGIKSIYCVASIFNDSPSGAGEWPFMLKAAAGDRLERSFLMRAFDALVPINRSRLDTGKPQSSNDVTT